MRRTTLCILALMLAVLSAPAAIAQQPLVERYLLAHGGTSGGPSTGVQAILFDEHFGAGTSKATVSFHSQGGSGHLNMAVWRDVKPGEITFALLVFRTEVRGYSSQGELIYTRDLAGFTFGDSSSGHWSDSLADLPPNIGRIQIAFVGNYE